jgi:hypothetical protein
MGVDGPGVRLCSVVDFYISDVESMFYYPRVSK